MKETAPTQENNPEKFKRIDLDIKEPDGVHRLEIIFDENNPKLVTAYNVAINEICNEQNELGIFHQTGRGNNGGYHAWEILGSANGTQKLLELFPSIHQRAKETYLMFEELNLFNF